MFEFLGIYMASQKAVAKLILGYDEDEAADKIEFYSDYIMAKGFETTAKGYGSLEGR